MTEVLLVGEPMGLFSATESGRLEDVTTFSKSIAGAELNVGIGLSRLNHTVEYVTKLGTDPVGQYIAEGIKKENIGRSYITYSETYQTGLMLKNKVDNGDPTTAYYRKASAFSTYSKDEVESIDFSEVKLLHVTGIPSAVNLTVREAIFSLMKRAKAAGTFITFDPNLRPALWSSIDEMIEVTNGLATYSDVMLPGISEGKILVGSEDINEIAEFYLNRGSKAVIIKNGASGAFVCEKGKNIKSVKGFKVRQVVDTVGAGDGFAVGVIHGYLNDFNFEKATVLANAIGSLQVQHAGDNEGLPTTRELENYIDQNKITVQS